MVWGGSGRHGGRHVAVKHQSLPPQGLKNPYPPPHQSSRCWKCYGGEAQAALSRACLLIWGSPQSSINVSALLGGQRKCSDHPAFLPQLLKETPIFIIPWGRGHC